MTEEITIDVKSLVGNPDYVRCPRCWTYHTVMLNHDGLCDRCQNAILTDMPDHESVPFIKTCLEAQARYFRVKR